MKTRQVNLDHLTGRFCGHFRGRLRGTFRGTFREVLEGLKTGKLTLVGPVVGALVGDLVGALVGPLVVPLVDPLVGRGSLSPALRVAQLSVTNDPSHAKAHSQGNSGIGGRTPTFQLLFSEG